MINIEMQKKGFTEAMLRFNNLKERLSDYKTPLMQIVAEMMYSVGKNFREQGVDGEKWAPLAASTIKSYMRRKGKKATPPFVILRDTGSLQNSIVPEITSDTARVGTNMKKAPALHYGSPKRHLPARKYMVIRKDALERIQAIGRTWAFGS